ncbi:MAG: hypothetical protein ACKO8I_16040 [Cyanobacteriota bacterium]
MSTPVRHDLTDPAIPEGMVRIALGSRYRFIWPVHLGGWQALGWQLQPANEQQPAEPRQPVNLTNTEPAPAPAPAPEPWQLPDVAPEPATATDFQAMTKAQILEHCSSVYGVELDGSQNKAELIEQATALEQQSVSCGPRPDALLDDPLI